MPDDTLVFMAGPNLGDAAHQVLTVFQRERQKNPALRAWCEQKNGAGFGPKMEDSLEIFYQLSQYLGDEIAISMLPSAGRTASAARGVKSRDSFHMAAVCQTTYCREYVVVATPISASTGGNSFCSTPDAVIRKHEARPLVAPVTAAQCKSWAPIE